jgi:GTP cyclohydrolase I
MNMNASVEGLTARLKTSDLPPVKRPSREEAEAAVRTLIAWAGDNPAREGLIDTPGRVTRAYEEFFEGYNEDPYKELTRTFEEVEGYQDMVMLRDVALESHCEHHMVAILGKAHIAYVPTRKVVGISKLARVLDIYAKRLQTQETMTAQIADTITKALEPAGVAILIEAKHQCMTTRGIKKPDVATITTQFTGVFRDDPRMEARFMQMIRG